MAEVKLLVDSSVFVDAFDPASPNHKESFDLLNYLYIQNKPITMPAHAWFEVECSLKKLIAEKRFVGPTFLGNMHYPVELIHIDKDFIENYKMVDIPYIKAGDHIFIVIAKVNDYPLVTSDSKMLAVANRCGVKVYEPKDMRYDSPNT